LRRGRGIWNANHANIRERFELNELRRLAFALFALFAFLLSEFAARWRFAEEWERRG
jgi:hypothetical protein